MKISRESRKMARQLFRLACDEQGRLVSARALEIVDHIVASKPRSFLGTLKEFGRLVRIEMLRYHARVVSASALDDTETAKMLAHIHQRFGNHISVEFLVDAALLGGVRIQVGNDVWDGTIRSRLQTLKQQIL